MACADFPIPGILYFHAGNPYTGSLKGMNYRILPIKADEDGGVAAHFEAAVWDGMLCSELADMRATAEFPLDVDGLAALTEWLRKKYEEMA